MTKPHELLALAIQANVPVIAWGPPGVGKTSLSYALADALGAHMEALIASIRDPSDFGGLPVREEDGVVMEPMGWARRVKENNDRGLMSIVFFDEISTAPPANQAALLRVIFDKVVGDLPLVSPGKRDLVRFIAAANPPEQAAGGWDLSAPLANRFFHLPWGTPNTADFIEGYLSGFPKPDFKRLPDNWENGLDGQKAITAGYLSTQPQDLLAIPSDEQDAGGAWPSPRTWEMLDKLLTAAGSVNMKGSFLELINGAVGKGVGKKYYTYMRDMNLPNPEDLIKDPSKFVLPARGDQVFAILTSVVYAVINGKVSQDRYNSGWEVLKSAANQSSVDIAAGAARKLAEHGLSKAYDDPDDAIDPFLPMLQEAGIIPTI